MIFFILFLLLSLIFLFLNRCDEAMLNEMLEMEQRVLEAQQIATMEMTTAAEMLEMQALQAQRTFE